MQTGEKVEGTRVHFIRKRGRGGLSLKLRFLVTVLFLIFVFLLLLVAAVVMHAAIAGGGGGHHLASGEVGAVDCHLLLVFHLLFLLLNLVRMLLRLGQTLPSLTRLPVKR